MFHSRHFSSFLRFTRSLSTNPSLSSHASPPPSRFASTPRGPEDAILGITLAYHADPSPNKINLGVGAYRDDVGSPFVLTPVRLAHQRLADRQLPMEYLPVAGSKQFCQLAAHLALGDAMEGIPTAKIQTLSGTGALRLAGAFIKQFLPVHHHQSPLVLLPDPSWANHKPIFLHSGCRVDTYAYYDKNTKGLDFARCIESLETAEEGAIVLLHACAHNPTGVDFTLEQWEQVSEVVARKAMLPLFDMAYQGFTTGDMDRDAQPVRLFVNQGHRIILAQSFSKNFGLYGHRVGCLTFVADSDAEKDSIESQLKILARPMYSNPPIEGVRIVEEVLGDPELESMWRTEMKDMADRITGVRKALRVGLEKAGSQLDWGHIEKQNGMFCYSGLTTEQVDRLKNDFSVYLTANGRISMAGVTTGNVDYLSNAIHQVTK